MVESRHIECTINTDEINSFQAKVPFFTFLKIENRWLSNVSLGYRNIIFSLNRLKFTLKLCLFCFQNFETFAVNYKTTNCKITTSRCLRQKTAICSTVSFNSFMKKVVSYKNQSIDMLSKLMDCFVYDRNLCHERVKGMNYRVIIT